MKLTLNLILLTCILSFANSYAQTPYAYISKELEQIGLIDLKTNKKVKEIYDSNNYNTLCVSASADGRRVYVSNGWLNTVDVVNTTINETEAHIGVGYYPKGICITPNGTKVYVACDDQISKQKIYLLDAITNTVVTSFNGGYKPKSLCLSPDGSRLYIASYEGFDSKVITVNTISNKIITTTNISGTLEWLTITPDGKKLYVTNSQENNVYVINTTTSKVMSTIAVDENPEGICISNDGKKLYVGNSEGNSITIIDTYADSAIITVPCGGLRPQVLSIFPDDSKLYIVNHDSRRLSILNTSTNSIIDSVDLDGYASSFGNFVTMVKPDSVHPYETDSLALIDLYEKAGGAQWKLNTNWKTSQPLKTWYGVTVNENIRRIIGLNLFDNGLKGSIPSSFGNLSALQNLNLSFNEIDSLPPVIGNLVSLKELNFTNSKLKGQIPQSIGKLYRLENLLLNNNMLSDSIPTSIGNLISLKSIYLNDNQLTGPIPDSMGNLAGLKNLYLYNNRLSGNLPLNFGNLQKLEFFSVKNNLLTGVVPEIFSNLKTLFDLSLENNQFSGQIPFSIGNATSLRSLLLSNNQLTGVIPPSLGNLQQVNRLDLSHNFLTGPLPDSLGRMSNCIILNLSYNQLSGPVPVSIPTPIDTSLQIQHNRFTFSDVERLALSAPSAYGKYSTFFYSPQANIAIKKTDEGRLYVSAGGTLSKNVYNWHKVGSLSDTTIYADSTFAPPDQGDYYVTVTNAVATDLTLHSDTASIPFIVKYLCPGTSNTFFSSLLHGINYQWQLDKGNGFEDLKDNQYFKGSTDSVFYLSNMSGDWSGYRFRCITNTTTIGHVFEIKFSEKWIGNVDTAWENPANWSCNKLPDTSTDVIIESGNIIISSNAFCKSLSIQQGATCTVKPGFKLYIAN